MNSVSRSEFKKINDRLHALEMRCNRMNDDLKKTKSDLAKFKILSNTCTSDVRQKKKTPPSRPADSSSAKTTTS